jgi:chemotaxis protein methyltransferase WspC
VAFTEIAALLKEKMGLDAESIGVAAVERAVRERLAAREMADAQLYWKELRASEQELQELIEAIVVPETWFFRDPAAFGALVRVVHEEWMPRHPQGTLRILSLPCSTGEEPFTMAMALLDSGFPPQRFHIDAIDISLRALAYARRGHYGKNSFRGSDLAFRDRHFEPLTRGFRVNAAVREQVQFRHGNLLASGWLHGAHGYHMIFCRNVLIYFDRPTQDRALEVLGRLLADAGLLFVGPSETGLLLDHGYVSGGMPLAFAFRQPAAAVRVTKRVRKTAPAVGPAKARVRPHVKPHPAEKPTEEPVLAPPAPWIDAARQLADQGNLIAALKCCELNLAKQPATAEGLHLAGMLHDAAGHLRQATEHYRKALYLDPRHHEALVHLAVALTKEGDSRGAQRLLDRANRQLAAGR